MQNIIYDIHSKSPLIIGYVEETEAREVEFRGFTKERTDTIVYINIDGIGRRPLLNYKLPIKSIYTKSKGTYEAYLVELKIDTDDETILYARKSNNFDLIIKHSAKMSDLVSEETDEFDDWFSAMGTLYQTVQTKLQNGELKGAKGDKGDKGDTGSAGADGQRGSDGTSPTVTTSKVGKVTTITITDASGSHSATINDGADGQNGQDGADGNDGTSISITNVSESTESGGTSTVTFSDGNTLSVKNGINGVDGSNGRDGSDAEVTSQNIANALGYTPADEDDVEQLNDDLANYNNTKVGYSEVENGQLKMYSDSTKAHLLATLDLPNGGISDATINGNSIVNSDGVAVIPNGNSSTIGVYRTNSSLGVGIYETANGNVLQTEQALVPDITARTSYFKVITPYNLVKSVDSVICSDSASEALTSEQQNKALARLGIINSEGVMFGE